MAGCAVARPGEPRIGLWRPGGLSPPPPAQGGPGPGPGVPVAVTVPFVPPQVQVNLVFWRAPRSRHHHEGKIAAEKEPLGPQNPGSEGSGRGRALGPGLGCEPFSGGGGWDES